MSTSQSETSSATVPGQAQPAQPAAAEGTLVTGLGDGQAYLVRNGERQLITNVSALFQLGVTDPRAIQHKSLAQDELERIPLSSTNPIATLTQTLQVDSGDVFLGAGHYMHTWGAVSTGGQIAMNTRTRTITMFGGFHGSVTMIFGDVNSAPTYQTQTYRYGVDGTWIGRSDRTDAWWEQMSADEFSRTTQLAIFHAWAPDSFQTILDRWVAAGSSIASLAGSVGSVAKVFTTIFA